MKFFAVAFISLISVASAAPTPVVRGPGGRLVQPGATCSDVQGVSICQDGFGNTF
ncbi:hypothetical protein FPSE_05994 [Fusarium pseudograminearum CS3096]|uniref:Uncharacterized protein n=1 Tax=Fusarium pseudograminearum (strain CS3096) TaxID=1028729 RepID=K3UNP4_FUSPC|nr:hypothetical protein FPSE_05994 [Fusarium pseudograminearum CS3096]EKJ73871.1 hypothetical protein FPSE_05994 [Fusarium pseudograminearum CS3096]